MANIRVDPERFPTHILCGLDLEARSKPAVLAAVWLSERLGAPLELVHAFPPRPILWGREEDMPEWVAGTEETGRLLRTALRSMLDTAPSELGLRTSADALRFHISSGHPAQVILERARTAYADLIVLGPHEKRGWLDVSNTARAVLAHAYRGVWVQPDTPTPPRRILVPVDMSPDSLAALATARDLASRLDARLTAMHAFSPPALGATPPVAEAASMGYVIDELERSERARFEHEMEAFDWRGVPHEARYERGEPAEVVQRLQGEHELVVMGTHGRTGLSAALVGSVAHAVLRASRIPVLALRHPRGTYLF